MRKLLVMAAFMGLAVGIAACTGSGDDDDDAATSPTPSPSPTGTPVALDFTLTGTGWPHNNDYAYVRVLEGTTVMWCTSAQITGMTFTVTSADLLSESTSYTWQTFADLDANGQYDGMATDHSWEGSFATTTTNAAITVPHATTQTNLSWPMGAAACP